MLFIEVTEQLGHNWLDSKLCKILYHTDLNINKAIMTI